MKQNERHTLNGGESGLTIAEAAYHMRRPLPVTERDLDRFAYDAPAYGVVTNCDSEPFWRAAVERERVRRLCVAHGFDPDETIPAFRTVSESEINAALESLKG